METFVLIAAIIVLINLGVRLLQLLNRRRAPDAGYPQLPCGARLLRQAPVPGCDDPFRVRRPVMIVLLVLLVLALFGLGFVNALWWVLGAVVVFGLFRHGRGGYGGWDREDDAGFRSYRDYRDRQDRWGRRYDRQRRGRRLRQDRQDREHHR
ncbi:hypothetical protein ABR738_31565 [Streptomyces sp. Edi4]|uniref:hypothetical protein n=1 Tax=Streptomyces sp. Edi4 TaxID=3162527 RepID=UPI0033067B96